MATVISHTGDNAIMFSGSEALVRQIAVPIGTSDLRVSITPCISSTHQSLDHTFNPAVSRYETFRYCFTSSPSATPGSGLGNEVGVGVSVGGNSTITGFDGVNFFKSLNNLGTIYSFSSVPTVNNETNTTNYELKAGNAATSFYMLRVYKHATIAEAFTIQFRVNTTSAGIALPQTQSTISEYLTNLANTVTGRQSTYTFASEAIRDEVFASLNTVCFTWPFTTVPVIIANMAYRAI